MNKRVALLLNTGKKEYDEQGYVENIAVCSIPVSAESNDGKVYMSIHDFITAEYEKKRRSSEIIYVRDLNESGLFLMEYLNNNDYKYSKEKSLSKNKQYSTVMSSGDIYQIKILVNEKPKRYINFYDISKTIPLKDEDINKGFGLNIQNYDTNDIYNESNLKLLMSNTIEYVKAMAYMFEMDLAGITLSSRAFSKLMASVPRYKSLYKPTCDEEYNFIHNAYDAGYNDLNEDYRGVDLGEVISLDVNSMYPSILRNELLPALDGVYYEGKGELSKRFPLYIQKIRFDGAVVKHEFDKVAMVNPFKGAMKSRGKYIEDIDEPTEMTMSNIMLELFLENYHVFNIEYIDGYKYCGLQGSFENFVDEWMDIKVKADRVGDKAMRTISKMVMNFSYGGFGKRRDRSTDHYDNEGVLQTEKITARNRYMPIAVFITSYAIKQLVDIRNHVGDRFVYADVDSVHLLGHEIPDILIDKIHSDKLGYWNIEGKFDRARFLKLKTYIEENDDELVIRTAGAGGSIKDQITYDNFHYGNEFSGMIKTERVKGGTIKREYNYKL